MTMTMTQERIALAKYSKLLQVIELRLLEKGIKDGQVQVSYYDFNEEPIEDLDTGIALLGRLENEGGIKVTARPERDYMNTDGDNYFTIEVLPKFWKILGDISGKIQHKPDELISVYYDKATGVGYAHKRFVFVKGEDNDKVFTEMYDNINTAVPRDHLKELLGFAGTGFADIINTLTKSIRRATGLTPNEIVHKKGNLSLIAKKLDKPPE